MKKIVAIIILLAGNAIAQKSDCIIPAALYGITAGMVDGLHVREINSTYKQARYLNSDWHKLKFVNQVSGVVLGVVIYRKSKSAKEFFSRLLFSGVIYWISHDIAYNIITNKKNILDASETSGSFLEKYSQVKPILLVVSIAL